MLFLLFGTLPWEKAEVVSVEQIKRDLPLAELCGEAEELCRFLNVCRSFENRMNDPPYEELRRILN